MLVPFPQKLQNLVLVFDLWWPSAPPQRGFVPLSLVVFCTSPFAFKLYRIGLMCLLFASGPNSACAVIHWFLPVLQHYASNLLHVVLVLPFMVLVPKWISSIVIDKSIIHLPMSSSYSTFVFINLLMSSSYSTFVFIDLLILKLSTCLINLLISSSYSTFVFINLSQTLNPP